MKTFRTFYLSTRLTLILGCITFAFPAKTKAAPELLNAVVAMVFDRPITVDDIKIQTAPLEEEIFREFGREPAQLQQRINELRQSALETLIERELIIYEFENAGYAIPDSVIEERVQERIRNQFGDQLTLTKTLQARGLTKDEFRRGIRQQVIVDALTAKNVSSVVLISPFEIERYYQENLETYQQEERIHLRMIFIPHEPGDDQLTPRVLGEIRQKVADGSATFADMASVYHNGSQRDSGGDWGWVERSVLREDLSAVAFSLKTGEMSEVLVRDEGCYLMLSEEHRDAEPLPLIEVRDDIERTLLAEERNRLQKQWVDQLRKKSYVRYY